MLPLSTGLRSCRCGEFEKLAQQSLHFVGGFCDASHILFHPFEIAVECILIKQTQKTLDSDERRFEIVRCRVGKLFELCVLGFSLQDQAFTFRFNLLLFRDIYHGRPNSITRVCGNGERCLQNIFGIAILQMY